MFGLIGENLSYSLSKKIHQSIREMEYNLIEIKKDDFHEFMTKKNFKGINVTIPYKEVVIPYLDYIHEEAASIGAINTILNINGRLEGYNTDIYGFKNLVNSLNISLQNSNILILGTGGSSKTAAYILKQYNPLNIIKASRNPQHNAITYEQAYSLGNFDLIVNTTPVGTFPNIDETPIDLSIFVNCRGVIDLVYNPRETALLKQANALNIPCISGIDMLYIQAIYANELFATLMENPLQTYQTVYPAKVHKTPAIPSSKSLCHRSIIAASLGTKESTLYNINLSDDIVATMEAMKTLGAKFILNKSTLLVEPINYNKLPQKVTIDCKDAGSTLRFLIPICASLGITSTFIGSETLFSRPLDIYADIFSKKNLNFHLKKNSLKIKGKLETCDFVIDTSKSSQFATGIIMALPLIGGGSIKLTGSRESYSYIKLTTNVIENFGIDIKENLNKFIISGNYTSNNYHVETDLSQFAFFAVLGAINSSLKFNNINPNSLQGDRVIIDILKNMGADLKWNKEELTIAPKPLQGITINISDCPDLAPILIVLGLFAQGDTILINTHRLKYKESPRDKVMAEELAKLGIKISVQENQVIIPGCQQISNKNKLHAHNDHRIAMALTILGLSSNTRIEIENFECVSKSFPDFWKVIQSIII